MQAVSVTQRVERGTRTRKSRRKTAAAKKVGVKGSARTRIAKKTKGGEGVSMEDGGRKNVSAKAS